MKAESSISLLPIEKASSKIQKKFLLNCVSISDPPYDGGVTLKQIFSQIGASYVFYCEDDFGAPYELYFESPEVKTAFLLAAHNAKTAQIDERTCSFVSTSKLG